MKRAHLRRIWLFVLLSAILLARCDKPLPWQLTNVSGHLPDLLFSLTSDTGKAITAEDYRGKVVMLYFGYTHCPDVCPTTMARLAHVMKNLGEGPDNVRILFVSMDPMRDTSTSLHSYVSAFDAHAVGLAGNATMIEALAKRYRVAYNAQPANARGDYEVAHSSAVYIFGKDGHARVLASQKDTIDSITHDVRLLLQSSS